MPVFRCVLPHIFGSFNVELPCLPHFVSSSSFAQALATASWTLITIQNGTGLPDGKCDTSKADITVLSACSQLVSGTIYIITYNVKLASCNLQSNITVRKYAGTMFDACPSSVRNMTAIDGAHRPTRLIIDTGQHAGPTPHD